jgi:transcriptional regulator CtsR
MSKISDIIEEFILEQLEGSDYINLSRNELAEFFSCAPSQINYVLSTRFTTPRGYIIESHRGGGGFIKLTRVDLNKNNYISQLLSSDILSEIDFHSANHIIDNLIDMNIISAESGNILSIAISSKSLSMPVKIENKQRGNILKCVLLQLLKGD